MPRQQEVAEAFFRGENQPSRASNFRIIPADDNPSVAYLVGGRGGTECIIAAREPIDQYELWRRPAYGSLMRYGHLRNQLRTARDAFHNELSDENPNAIIHNERQPLAEEYDELAGRSR